MAKRVAGICYLQINGVQYPVRGSWEYTATPTKREGVAGQDSVHGYKETPRVPGMKGDVTDMGNLSIQLLQQSDIAGATLELANGKVVTGTDGWVAGEPATNTEEGRFNLELEFKQVLELPSK